jgi:type VI secretion system secreted protein Hcp
VISACVNVTTTATSGPLGGGPVIVPNQQAANLTVIDTAAGQHCVPPDGTDTLQTTLAWNATDPTGPTGASGQDGKSVTVVSGHTLTLPGGGVLTVGGGGGKTYTITGPPVKPSRNALTLSLGSLSLPILGYSLINGGGNAQGGGGGAGKVAVHDISISKKFDQASPTLLKACLTGKHFSKGIIVVRKAGGNQMEFLTITMKDMLITSYQTGGSGHNVTPTETLSLNFTKIEFKYTTQK